MNEKVDLRIIKTKRTLYNTLETLMKTQAFEEIKVSDICSHALINRSTFYSHYTDKYELLNDYINVMKNNLSEKLSQNQNYKNTKDYYMEMLSLLLEHIESKKADYAAIMVNNKNSIVMDIIYDVSNRFIINEINNSIRDVDIPSEIISKFYSGAIFNVCIDWINSKKYSKKEILNFFDKLLPEN